VSNASPHAALALIVALLSVTALASTRVAPTPTQAGSEIVRPAPLQRSAVVRALRDGETVDINAAAVEELVMLPRIGPALAARIIAARTERGGFRDVQELRSVRGIGPVTFEGLSRLVRVGSADGHRSNSSDPVSATVK
jgi:competence ComEA-like helix-hairpin-helix protein